MNLFQDILEKIKVSIQDKAFFKERILEEINPYITRKLTIDDISIKERTLTISVQPTFKMAILLQKDAILKRFAEKNIPISSIK